MFAKERSECREEREVSSERVDGGSVISLEGLRSDVKSAMEMEFIQQQMFE